ncbi:hypothetical protein BDW72DRAFT_211012 [Aspergillus terricola var. indicus]
MVNVAVAGGTGGVGRTIVEALGRSLYQAFVLSRKPLDGGIYSNPNITAITVDYAQVDSLVHILETHRIHTAAKLSKETKGIVPSSFAIQYPREATTLKSYLRPNVFVIDITNRVAAIPGDGNAPVTLTYSFDLARLVVQSLNLKDGEWDEESRVVGDEISWNEFVSLAEEMLGCNFKVHHDPTEKLKNIEITELPGHRALYERFPKERFRWFMSIFELFTVDGGSRLERRGSLNERFPGVIPATVRDVLGDWKDEALG